MQYVFTALLRLINGIHVIVLAVILDHFTIAIFDCEAVLYV